MNKLIKHSVHVLFYTRSMKVILLHAIFLLCICISSMRSILMYFWNFGPIYIQVYIDFCKISVLILFLLIISVWIQKRRKSNNKKEKAELGLCHGLQPSARNGQVREEEPTRAFSWREDPCCILVLSFCYSFTSLTAFRNLYSFEMNF
jgi:hypothetical protein